MHIFQPTAVCPVAPRDSHPFHVQNTLSLPHIPRFLNLLQHQLKSKISSTYQQPPKSKCHHRNQVRVALGYDSFWDRLIHHPWTLKWEICCLLPKYKGRTGFKSAFYNILPPNGRKGQEEKGHQTIALSKSKRVNSIRAQGLGIILCDSCPHPLGPQLWHLGAQSSALRVNLPFNGSEAHVCNSGVFVSPFPAGRVLGFFYFVISLSLPVQAGNVPAL